MFSDKKSCFCHGNQNLAFDARCILICGLSITRDPNLRPSFSQLTSALKTVQRLVTPSQQEPQSPPVHQEISVNSTPWEGALPLTIVRSFCSCHLCFSRSLQMWVHLVDWAPQVVDVLVLLPWQGLCGRICIEPSANQTEIGRSSVLSPFQIVGPNSRSIWQI
jgi:hypothetical protein